MIRGEWHVPWEGETVFSPTQTLGLIFMSTFSHHDFHLDHHHHHHRHRHHHHDDEGVGEYKCITVGNPVAGKPT